MASGILGGVVLPESSVTTVYTVPEGKQAAITVNAVNRSTVDNIKYWLALTANVSPASQDYIEFESQIVPTGVLERTSIIIGAGTKVLANANVTGITVVVWGFEETAS